MWTLPACSDPWSDLPLCSFIAFIVLLLKLRVHLIPRIIRWHDQTCINEPNPDLHPDHEGPLA